MACVSRSPDHPLTPMQKKHLLMLLTAGAITQAAAMNVHALNRRGRQGFPNTVVIGALCDKGLAAKRQRGRRGRRFTVYWLTIAGEREARALARDAHAPAVRARPHADDAHRVAPARAVRPGTEVD